METTNTAPVTGVHRLPAREQSGIRRVPSAVLDMDPLALIESEEPTLILDDGMLDEVRMAKPSVPPPPPAIALRPRAPKNERVDLDALVTALGKTANENGENGKLPTSWEIPVVGGVPCLAAPVMRADDSRVIRLGPLSLTWG